MKTVVDIDVLKARINALVRHAAQMRIGDHSRLEGFELRETPDSLSAGKVLGNWMSIILVTGEAFRVTLKFHFSLADARGLSRKVYGANTSDDVSNAQAVDFIKELSNLTAGYVVQVCEGMNIPMGISLPLCTRGFYEVFSDYSETSHPLVRYTDTWSLCYLDARVHGTAMVEISDANALEPLLTFQPEADVEADDDSDFDFL